ncbi:MULTISPECIES: phage holin family protein [Sphingobacterium]|uniref:phage holin family protein n=1 Tax=Sphingobacterium TaxID=28453 RepID=UPI00257F1D5D|nr:MULTISPECIES: phage holin family protein [Sphingobacterium]
MDLIYSFFTWLASTWFGKAVLFFWIYFAPIWISLLVIGIFVLIDVITALMRAKKNNIPIRSKRLRDTIGKSTAYMLALMVSHMFQVHFMPIVPVLQVVAVFIATAELKSIMENLGDVANLDFWTIIKERLSGTNKNYSKDDDKIKE